MINVKTAYSAYGDGVHDDTTAILNAIKANIGGHGRVLFFPSGTYVVTNQLVWKNANGNYRAYLSLQGECQSTTVIRLADGTSGFGDPANPKAVIFTATDCLDNTCDSLGEGEEAYFNNIWNLTVDTGKKNSGAIGIDWLANNQGIVDNVTIKSEDLAGDTGLYVARSDIGPAEVKNLTVSGFKYGISARRSCSPNPGCNDYSVNITGEHISLSGQSVAGIANDDLPMSIRDLQSTNSVPAYWTSTSSVGISMLTLVGANLVGGSSTQSAIDMGTGQGLLRAVSASGYQSALKYHGSVVSGLSLSDYPTQPALSQFPGGKSLMLPIDDTPVSWDPNPLHWANVVTFGAGGVDSTTAIQKAIDSGATTIYFPPGYYIISQPIIVRGNVQMLISPGGQGNLQPAVINTFSPTNPAVIVQDTTAGLVQILRMNWNCNGNVAPCYKFPGADLKDTATTTKLVVKDSTMRNSSYAAYGSGGTDYQNTIGAASLYLEDVETDDISFDHQTVWARQLDPDGNRTTNNGGTVWILGLTEEPMATVLVVQGNATTELLGGDVLTNGFTGDSTVPVVIIDASPNTSLTYTEGQTSQTVAITETEGAVTKQLLVSQMPAVGSGHLCVLYTG